MKYKTWSLLFGYASTSYYLLKHPELLHVRNTKTLIFAEKDKIVVGHRGGSIENPENSLQAFKACSKAGIAIETDVRQTADGHMLICHDPNFKRVAGVDALVSDTPLDQVPKAFSSEVEVEFGHHTYRVKPEDRAEYCTLEQLFSTVPKNHLIFLDIKDADFDSCLRVRQLVEKYERAEHTLVCTMQHQNMVKLREVFKGTNILKIACWEESIAYAGAYLFGLLPFLSLKGVDFILPPFLTRDWTRFKLEQRAQFSIFSPSYWMLNAYVCVIPLLTRLTVGMVEHLDKRGVVMGFWVLNNDDEIETVVKHMKVKCIISDRPQAAAQIIKRLTTTTAPSSTQAVAAEGVSHPNLQ